MTVHVYTPRFFSRRQRLHPQRQVQRHILQWRVPCTAWQCHAKHVIMLWARMHVCCVLNHSFIWHVSSTHACVLCCESELTSYMLWVYVFVCCVMNQSLQLTCFMNQSLQLTCFEHMCLCDASWLTADTYSMCGHAHICALHLTAKRISSWNCAHQPKIRHLTQTAK